MSDKKDESAAVLSIADLPVERSSEFRSLYSNYARFNVSNHDVSITLCEIIPGETQGASRVVEQARIVMAPTFADTFLEAMARNLARAPKVLAAKQSGKISPAK